MSCLSCVFLFPSINPEAGIERTSQAREWSIILLDEPLMHRTMECAYQSLDTGLQDGWWVAVGVRVLEVLSTHCHINLPDVLSSSQ